MDLGFSEGSRCYPLRPGARVGRTGTRAIFFSLILLAACALYAAAQGIAKSTTGDVICFVNDRAVPCFNPELPKSVQEDLAKMLSRGFGQEIPTIDLTIKGTSSAEDLLFDFLAPKDSETLYEDNSNLWTSQMLKGKVSLENHCGPPTIVLPSCEVIPNGDF